jgi:mannose-6-phosphate isomerase
MSQSPGDLLRFREGYFERVWGGNKMRTLLGKDTPPDKVIGEAWLVSDHAELESIVAEGPFEGQSLRALLERDAGAILGARPELTIHGRFPLLLKILDAAQALSVQVHPDDESAQALGEPDVGKTEMWHVLDADPDSVLICGLTADAKAEAFAHAIADGSVEQLMTRFLAPEGTSVFVSAGTVHAIGGGILLAEIQQNSNLTYRIYDWGRVGLDGKPRQLHVNKAIEVTHFGSEHGGPSQPLALSRGDHAVEFLCACRHFAAELVKLRGESLRTTRGETFHIVLAKEGSLTVRTQGASTVLAPGQAALVTGAAAEFQVTGDGAFLDYYGPDLLADVVRPLLAAGHSEDAIARLGGTPRTSDLAGCLHLSP